MDEVALPHHPRSAHDGAYRPAGDADAVVGRPAGARGDPTIADGLPSLEVDHGQVGVVSDGDAALAANAKEARGPMAGEIDEAIEREPPGVDVVEHDGDQRM